MDKIKIVIADDYTLLREAWQVLIQERSDMEVVACVSNGQEVIDQIRIRKVDLVLMDINMPVMDGIAATEIISNTTPWVKVLALTMHSEAGYIKKMFQAGARGFLPKVASRQELIEAILKVYKGDLYIHPTCSNKLVDNGSNGHERSASLTLRELDVIKLVIAGHTSREIAEKLFISPKTVDVHKNNIFAKLNIHNVASLTRIVVEKGIVF
ncbi:MAG: two component transcriptional regulator, LuxR family protein [Bacteroidetes bacterium]|jgi:DNA-binding NarL/FixJ family response regulator|nr:two component transcriptional regulator, LuxR family protein [Bacteroidota bacterium]